MIARRARSQVKTLSSLSRINLLHELQVRGSMTIMELAVATGLHHNTAREHLHCLIDAGFVRAEPIPRTSKGRPKILYRAATRPGDPAREARLQAADVRTEQLRRLVPIRDIRSDRTSLDRQLDVLDDHLDQCGFDADITVDASRMTVHACPFSDLARENPQVCQVHFALVKDALELTNGPLSARKLHPFSGIDECTLDFGGAPRAIP